VLLPLPRKQYFRGMNRRSMVGTVLRDVQFWIPVIVLIGGLLVLRIVAR